MTIAKRLFTAFSAFALCVAMSLGSLSFMPKSFAVSDYEFPFSEEEALSHIPSDAISYFCYVWSLSGNSYIFNIYYHTYYTLVFNGNNLVTSNSGGRLKRVYYSSSTGVWNTNEVVGVSFESGNFGSPFPFRSSNVSGSVPSVTPSFAYSFPSSSSSPSSIPVFGSYQPFFFPELPYGYFDGHINSIDGSFNLDYPSSTITGSINQNGFDTYSLNLPNTSSSGEFNYNDTTGIGGGWFNTSSGSGTIAQTAVSTDTITLNVQDAPITYIPSYNETARFRTWAVVSGSSYCYFICDTRNTITGSLESVSGDNGKLRFSAVGADNVHYPFFCIEFAFDGTKLQTLQALPKGFTVDFKGGTLEQDQDTGIWSCDPLYHGFWLSDGCPPVVLSSLTDDSFKWLANPVFGEEAFTLNFLSAINENISGLRSDLSSFQSAMQSSISNQTSAFQNMDAPSATQPSTSQMMDYFSKESAFSAPNTDEVFSGDIKSGHYWDGVTWWSSKFNDIIVSNQVIVAFTTAMLTLGLAVLIIGRRFSMR